MMSIEDIMASIKQYDTRYVTVTGGEPLAQKEVIHLLKTLADSNYEVSIETGGGLSIKEVDQRIKIILDIKTPESGEEKKNHWENLDMISQKMKLNLCFVVVKIMTGLKKYLININSHKNVAFCFPLSIKN